MIEGENKEVQTEEKNAVAPVEGAETTNVDGAEATSEATTDAKEESQQAKPELTDDAVLEYFKSKGREVDNIDTLFEKPEVKEVNPYEDLLDDEDKAYLDFKKSTGRGRKEFESLNKNYDEVDPLILARERVLKEAGVKLTNDQIDEYIAETLGIDDLTEPTAKDRIELAKYAKPVRDEYKAEQEKYRKPAENKKVEGEQPKYVKLTNGAVMLESEFKNQQKAHQEYIEKAKEAVNSVTESTFKITIDDNGVKKDLELKYELSEDDRQGLVSDVSNLDAAIQKDYHTKDGFNHKQFAEDRFWMKKSNREKAISAITQTARAEAIAEVLQARGNVNFETRSTGLPNAEKQGVKYVPVKDLLNL